MRVLMLTPATPYLPTHDRASAQQAWASSVAASVVRVPVKRWRQPLTGAAADGVAAFRAAALAAIADFAPDVVHLEGSRLAVAA